MSPVEGRSPEPAFGAIQEVEEMSDQNDIIENLSVEEDSFKCKCPFSVHIWLMYTDRLCTIISRAWFPKILFLDIFLFIFIQ